MKIEETKSSKLANQARLEQDCEALRKRESELHSLLTADVCHTDEEKSAVEIELSETRGELARMLDSLAHLKRLDQEELNNEEERLQLMCESSVTGLEREISSAKQRVIEKREEQRVLDTQLDEYSRLMSQLLVELEQAENQRRIDENKIFQCKISYNIYLK